MRFPSFMKRGKERRMAKKAERKMAMKGWDDGEMSKPKMAGNSQRQMPLGVGHHLARMAGITRSRGQKIS